MSVEQKPPVSQEHRRPSVLDELQAEAISAAKSSGEALASFAWLWPIRGIIYTAMRELILTLL